MLAGGVLLPASSIDHIRRAMTARAPPTAAVPAAGEQKIGTAADLTLAPGAFESSRG
ncbi:hypothetical protein PUN4_280280 [Paraburkholderia unamae]|nr:hypothetical protein PUN4_280280 [Paraburkholderia unamae]